MKKILKLAAMGAGALLGLFVAVGLSKPSSWVVERQLEISAKPETLISLIAEPRRWEEWAAWNSAMDPEAQWVFFGPAKGEGAMMAWKGEKLGKGLLAIVKVEPGRVLYQMQMEGRLTLDGENTKMEGGSPAKGTFLFAPDGEKTLVTWRDQGSMGMNLPARFFIPTIEKMLGAHFETGLQNLKQKAEEADVISFWSALQVLCGDGRAYAGRMTEGTDPSDRAFGDQQMRMRVETCTDSEIRIPFEVGADRSRTWVLTRTATGLRLVHEHRGEGGAFAPDSGYGGDSRPPGTSQLQAFPANEDTAARLPRAATNVWWVEMRPRELFAYSLRRDEEGRRFRVEFDLSRPAP